jgi:hypothetical protein
MSGKPATGVERDRTRFEALSYYRPEGSRPSVPVWELRESKR